MAKRAFDIILAAAGLIVFSPLLLVSAAGVRLSGPGSVFFRAKRAGKGDSAFYIIKFRTMRERTVESDRAITGINDRRIYPVGGLLRALKIDELPQLWNVLRGDMSLVGPRPEDFNLARDHYTDEQRLTLDVLPGIASPGSIYNYMFADKFLRGADPERSYIQELLPRKLALELDYVRRASFSLDLRIIAQTVAVIIQVGFGRQEFGDPDTYLAEALPDWDAT